MKIGEAIKFIRLSAGLKQSELATRLGVSSNYISMLESNKREPSLSFLRELSKSFDVPLGLLFLDLEPFDDIKSSEERALLIRLKDLMFEIERLRLSRAM